VKKALVIVLVIGAVVAVELGRRVRDEAWPPVELSEIDDPAQLDGFHLELPAVEPQAWIRTYLPEKTSSGYNVVLFRRRVPMIIDMNGRVVHIWPKVRGAGRVRLGRDGHLLVMGIDNLIKEYDWNGNLRWFHQLPDKHDLPHHDLVRLANGNVLLLAHDGHTHAGYLREVDADSEVVWEWRAVDHIDSFPTWDPESNDPIHMNSIRELPQNRWHAAGDERFRPGNILVSARNLDTIFIIDKASGEVVWKFSDGLDRQHEAVMDDQGWLGDDLILFFNNGLTNRFRYRRSLVQAIEPLSGEVVWEYGSEFFFSAVGGTAQILPGGNIMITSAQGGRVFEITSGGDIVWEWVPPYLPMRPQRIPFDHCPQLAAIPRSEERGIHSDLEKPYISLDLYSFAMPDEVTRAEIGGRRRNYLNSHEGCRELLVPPKARLRVEFGIDEERLKGREIDARFTVTVAKENRAPKTVVDVSLTEGIQDLWQRHEFSLFPFAYQQIKMCISTEAAGEMKNPLKMVVWAEPRVISKEQHPHRKRPKRKITDQERRLREQQLRVLGYVQ
jgi:hypothetical protein